MLRATLANPFDASQAVTVPAVADPSRTLLGVPRTVLECLGLWPFRCVLLGVADRTYSGTADVLPDGSPVVIGRLPLFALGLLASADGTGVVDAPTHDDRDGWCEWACE